MEINNLKLKENFDAFKICCKALEEQSLIEYVKFIRDLHERLVAIFNDGGLTETEIIFEFDDIKDLCYPIVDEDCWPPPDNNMKFIEIFNFVKSEINSFNEPNFQERINEYFKIFNKENNFPIIKEYAVIYEDKIEWHGKCQDLAYCLSNAIGGSSGEILQKIKGKITYKFKETGITKKIDECNNKKIDFEVPKYYEEIEQYIKKLIE